MEPMKERTIYENGTWDFGVILSEKKVVNYH